MYIHVLYAGKKSVSFKLENKFKSLKKKVFLKLKKKWVYSQKKLISHEGQERLIEWERFDGSLAPPLLKHLLLNDHMFYFMFPCLLDAQLRKTQCDDRWWSWKKILQSPLKGSWNMCKVSRDVHWQGLSLYCP